MNATIQELRNLSWLVQKQKHSLPNFDEWYSAWSLEAGADPVMRWIVNSRNRIVKEGDLELLSRMSARYHLDWVASGEIEIDLPPRLPLVAAVHAMHARIGSPPFGLVTVSRTWTDCDLPGRELLSALSGPYERSVELIARAHESAGAEMCGVSLAIEECDDASAHPACMADAMSHTQVSIDGASGYLSRMRHYVVARDADVQESAVARYGSFDSPIELLHDADAIDAVDAFVQMGRQILAVDDDLVVLVAYFDETRRAVMESGKPDDHYGKVLWADGIASTALNTGAVGVLVSADSWMVTARQDQVDNAPVADRPDRREALWVAAVTRDGRLRSAILPYTRLPDGSAEFGEMEENGGCNPNMLEPLRKAWGVKAWRLVSPTS